MIIEGNNRPTLEEWEHMGKPELWKLEEDFYYEGDRIEIWTESGYGNVKLKVNEEEEARGKDTVEIGKYILQGPFYHGGTYRLLVNIKNG